MTPAGGKPSSNTRSLPPGARPKLAPAGVKPPPAAYRGGVDLTNGDSSKERPLQPQRQKFTDQPLPRNFKAQMPSVNPFSAAATNAASYPSPEGKRVKTNQLLEDLGANLGDLENLIKPLVPIAAKAPPMARRPVAAPKAPIFVPKKIQRIQSRSPEKRESG